MDKAQNLKFLQNLHQMFLRSRSLVKDEVILNRFVSKVKSYNDKTISNLIDNHFNNKEKLNQELEKVSNEWVIDFSKLIGQYSIVFKELSDICLLDEHQEFGELQSIHILLQKVMLYVSNHPLYFSEESIKSFKKSFESLIEKLKVNEEHETKMDFSGQHHKHPKLGFFKKIMKNGALTKEILKLDVRLSKLYDELEDALLRIDNQLEAEVKPDFLLDLEEYIEDLRNIEAILYKIRTDMRILISHYIIQHNEIKVHVLGFFRIIKGYDVLNNSFLSKMQVFYEGKENFDPVWKLAETYLKNDLNTQGKIKKAILFDDSLFQQLMTKVKS